MTMGSYNQTSSDSKSLWSALWLLLGTLLAYTFYPWVRRTIHLSRLPVPRGNWLIGHLATLARYDHHKIMTDWAAQLGGIYRIRLAWVHAVIVTAPHLVAVVLDRANEVEKNSDAVYSKFNVLVHAEGKSNIFTSKSNDYWKLVRKGIMPAFSSNNIRKGFHYVVHANEQLISILTARGPKAIIDIDNAAQRITLDVIGRVGFDKDFGATQSLDDDSTNRAFELMNAGRDEGLKRYNNSLRKYFTFLPSVRKGEQDYIDFRQIMADLLREIKARGPLQDSDVSVAAHLLRIIDPASGRPLPDDRIEAEIGVLFTGGFETTGHTIAWAIFCISQDPEVERKVLAELDSMGLLLRAGRPKPKAIEFGDLANLTYTYNAIKEAMRLYPVTSDGTNRVTTRDTWLGKYLIPRGTMVWVPFSAMFNSPHNFSQVDKYIPERWEEPDAEYASPSMTQTVKSGNTAKEKEKVKRFIPFSNGPRDCAGQSLARMNYTTTVAMLLSHFSFKLADEMGGAEAVRSSASSAYLTLAPMHGLKMHCIPRA